MNERTDQRNERPWIVVLGASAGGLEALQQFVAALDADVGAAFVVVQHLAPDRPSMMPDLLQRSGTLPAREIADGDAPCAGALQLMPPGHRMTLQGEAFQLTSRVGHQPPMPIDHFLSSLVALDPGRCIAVVMSGTGSDGTLGCRALKAAGGLVMVQEPESAAFDSMPRSVRSAVDVDFCGDPVQLAQRVSQAVRADSAPPLAPPEEPALARLFGALQRSTGVDFGDYKPGTVLRRIERRMKACALSSMADYAARVDIDPNECDALYHELLIPVTSFFRDPAAFDALSLALRELLLQRDGSQPLRLWCAGCATGEEVYSVAITALEACQATQRFPGIKVFGTDVDDQVLAVASDGRYAGPALGDLSSERIDLHFVRHQDHIAVKPELRQLVLFTRHDLIEHPPFTRLDVAVCRNTLIYLQPEAQERALRRLQYALNPGGLLFLGHSESLGALNGDFAAVDAAHKVYRVVRTLLRPFNQIGKRLGSRQFRVRQGLPPPREATGPLLTEQAGALLAEAHMPPSLLVSGQRQVLHAWGATERFLRLPAGQPQLDVLRLLPPRLGAVVSHAIGQALQDQRRYQATPLQVELESGLEQVQVCAMPVGGAQGDRAEHVVVSLVTLPASGANSAEPALRLGDGDAGLDLLQRELAETRHSLQASVQELESANEEMQVTNEELMSSNEELQSANEELQSVNEELYTVNAEYNAKLDLVNALNADLEGMSRATGIATLFVDQSLRLVRFTPEALLLFRLQSSDIGREITDFSCQLDYPDLESDLRRALSGPSTVERDVPGPAGSRFLVRVLGYGDTARGQRRAVLSLVDVTRVFEAQRLQALLDALPQNIAVIDARGTIRQVNRRWTEFSQANGDSGPGTGTGINYLTVLARSPAPEAQQALAALEQLLAGNRRSAQLFYPCHSPDAQRWFVMNAAPLPGSVDGRPTGAVVAHFDVTPWIHAQGEADLTANVGRADAPTPTPAP